MPENSQHVFPRGDRWSVLRRGATRVSGTFDTQGQAIAKAREIARKHKGDLLIHGRDGLIKKRVSYGERLLAAKNDD